MLDRRLQMVHGTQGVSTHSMNTNKENVEPVGSSSGVSASALNRALVRSRSADNVANASSQIKKPLTNWLINWIDVRSSAAQSNATSTLVDQNSQQSQANSLNLSSDQSNQNKSMDTSVVAEQQKVPEENEATCSNPTFDDSVDQDENLSPFVSTNNDQQSIDSVNLTPPTQSSTSTTNASDSVVGANAEGKRAAKRPRSKSMYVSRDVRLRLSPPRIQQLDHPRRSNRISVPVHRYNYGMVYCSVCKKKFRQDLPMQCYAGDIVCSVECFKKG